MKNSSDKDRLPEIIATAVSALLVAAIFFTGSAGKITIAAAQVMFFSDKKATTLTLSEQNASEKTTREETNAAPAEKQHRKLFGTVAQYLTQQKQEKGGDKRG